MEPQIAAVACYSRFRHHGTHGSLLRTSGSLNPIIPTVCVCGTRLHTLALCGLVEGTTPVSFGLITGRYGTGYLYLVPKVCRLIAFYRCWAIILAFFFWGGGGVRYWFNYHGYTRKFKPKDPVTKPAVNLKLCKVGIIVSTKTSHIHILK